MKNLTAIVTATAARLLVAVVLGGCGMSSHAESGAAAVSGRSSFVNVPLYFEATDSATSGEFQFVARGQSRSVQLSPQRALLSLVKVDQPVTGRQRAALTGTVRGRSVAFDFLRANPATQLVGEGELPGRLNYLIGASPAEWRQNLPTFTRVRARQIYPGIDVVYYGNQSRLEYDFVLNPGARPDMIAFVVTGADHLRVDAQGDLVLRLGDDEVRQLKPIAYQELAAGRREVSVAYRLRGRTVSFELGAYDRTRPLVIDPVLSLLTFFNGSGSDIAWDVALQGTSTNGFLFVAGETLSANLPATPGAFTNQYAGGSTVGGDVFVAKLDLTQNTTNLVYLTYLGGRSHDGAFSVAVDAEGNAYFTGYTASTNFPIVGGAQTNLNLGIPTTPSFQNVDGFVAKLSASGSNLLYSTFLGGSGVDEVFSIAVDTAGQAYVTGFTESTNFPLANAAFTNFAGGSDVFVTCLSVDGGSFIYSFPMGGQGTDRGESITVDSAGNAFVCGYTRSPDFPITTNVAYQTLLNRVTNVSSVADAILLKISPAGAVTYASFFGGNRDDNAINLTSDPTGAVYLCGSTQSTNFVVTTTNLADGLVSNSDPSDVFVTKFDSTLTNVIYSVVFGGTAKDEAWDLAVDAAGRAYVVGDTFSTGMPVTNTAGFLNSTNSGSSDVFVGRLNADGTALDYLGYLGGRGPDLAYAAKLDAADNLYFVGQNGSKDFPTAPVLGGTADGFVAKLADLPARLVVSPGSLVFNPVLTGAVAQASFVVTNSGSTTLNATASLTSDPFFLLGTNSTPVASLGFAVPAFTATNILVRFVAPASSGAFTNEVVFVSNGGDSTNTVAGFGFGTPVIIQPGTSDGEFFFSFETTSGVSYDVQFKDALDASPWQVLQTVSGDGTLKSITDFTTNSAQRFFRLRAH